MGADGKEITLESPFGDELPAQGFDPGMDTYQAPPEPEARARVQVSSALAAASAWQQTGSTLLAGVFCPARSEGRLNQ